MHPWRQIVRGGTKEGEAMRCFMCLENIPSSDGDMENVKKHITTVHCAKCNVEKLADMCREAEEREDREGWSLHDIIEEERERRKAAEKRRAEPGGLMEMLRRKLFKSDCLVSDAERNSATDNVESDCFLCKEKFYLNTNVYSRHLQKKHTIMFGLKEIRECKEEEETWL